MAEATRSVAVGPEDAGERADRALARILGVPRSRLTGWFAAGLVRSGGRPLRPADRVRPGAQLEIPADEPATATPHLVAVREPPPALRVVYEDAALLIVDKPAGLVVHPAAGHWDDTLVHALAARPEFAASVAAGELRPGIVHRLDKDTSGLMVVAKTPSAHAALEAAFRAHQVERTYAAVVRGVPPAERGRVEAPLGRDPRDRLRFTVRADGRVAITHFRVLERHMHGAVLALRLETGRTHQIRVHLAHIGIPVAGDPLYGTPEDRRCGKGQLLHSWRLRLAHPLDGTVLRFEAPWPERMERAVERLRAGEEPLPPCPA